MGSRARSLLPAALGELTAAHGAALVDPRAARAARTGRTLLGAGPPCAPDRTVGVGMTIKTGDLLAGKYEAVSLLGSGGCSFVLVALHRGFDSEVALKFFNAELVSHGEAARRFAAESRSNMRLRSEHIVRVFDVDRLANGQPFLVMELLRGYDLRVALGDRGRLSIERSLSFALQVCEALATAHAVDIVHLDLKPENLFVTGIPHDEQLKVLDFGSCRDIHESSHRVATLSAEGTPPYMSPEQMRGAREVDERSDLWSLGCIVYEMLTGRSPFARRSLPEACAAVLEQPVEPVRRLRPEVPRQLEEVVLWCLEKEPSRRPQTVVELAHALAALAPHSVRRHARRCQQILDEHGRLRSTGVHAPGGESEGGETPLLLTQPRQSPVRSEEPGALPRAPRRWEPRLRALAVCGVMAFGCYASLRPSPRVAKSPLPALRGELCELAIAPVAEPAHSASVLSEPSRGRVEPAPRTTDQRMRAAQARRAARHERRARARAEAHPQASARARLPEAVSTLDVLDLAL